MRLNQHQIEILSKYFADLSKILVASTVIGFFVPTGAGLVALPVFATGLITAVACLVFSVRLLRANAEQP